MGRSKTAVVISLFSLLVATGSVVTLFSVRGAVSKDRSRVKATAYLDDANGPQMPMPIDPATINYQRTGKFAVDMKKVAALAVDADDRIYVAGDSCFCRYWPDGRLESRTKLTFEPTCMVIGGRQHIVPGRIYVGFADHVEVFNPDGTKEAIWQGVDKARFTSISTSDHDVYIADAGWNVVQHFDTTGKLLSPIGESSPGHFAPAPGGPAHNFDLVVGLDDLVYVVDRRDCRIEGYDAAGEVERHWGQASPAYEDFAGSNNPAQIALTGDGRFATVEEDPLRIKVYDRAGKMTGVVCGPDDTGPVADLAADHHNRILVLDGAARCVRIFEEKITAKAKEK
jgi:DNA-binding beta-propeller fold protein YncE